MNRARLVTSLAGTASLIAAATLGARVAGFARVLVFADSVRAGGVGQIYQAVNAVPNVVFEVAAGGILAAVAVPLIGGYLGRGDRAAADRLGSVLLTWVLVVLVPMAGVVIVCAGPITNVLVEQWDPSSRQVGATMLRVFAVQVPLYGLGIVLSGILQAHRRFLAVALAPLLSSVVVLATYLGYGHLVAGQTSPSKVSASAIALLAWGTTAGVGVLSLPLFVPALRTGWRWRPGLRLAGDDRRRVRDLSTAGLLGLLAQQVCVVVTVRLAMYAADGVLPVQQYVQAVYLLPYAVLAVPVATSVSAKLAQDEGAGSRDVALLARALRTVVLLMALAAAALIAAAGPLGTLFSALDARRGSTGASSVALNALPTAVVSYAPGLVGFGVSALLVRALYVRGHALAAGAAVAAGWVVAAGLPWVWSRTSTSARETLVALGLGSSVGMGVSAVLLAFGLRRTWGGEVLAGLGRTSAGSVLAMAVGGVAGGIVGGSSSTGGVGQAVVRGAAAALTALGAGLVVSGLWDRDLVRAVVRRRAGQGAGER